jgi:hypothetical protein
MVQPEILAGMKGISAFIAMAIATDIIEVILR